MQRKHGQWAYVAGYLDGDGSVEIKVGVFTLHFALTWADTYKGQLEHIQAFLAAEGMNPSRIRGGKSTLGRRVWHVSVWEPRGVLRVCQETVYYLIKKKEEAQAAIDYLQDKITGNEAIRVFNDDRMKGKWSGKIRREKIPWKVRKGFALAKRACGWLQSSQIQIPDLGLQSPRTGFQGKPKHDWYPFH